MGKYVSPLRSNSHYCD